MGSGWLGDVLGPGFEQHTIDLGHDDEGSVVATLVRFSGSAGRRSHEIPPRITAHLGSAPLSDVDVLSVHGWSDFFFEREVAEFWGALGARFYALDLRKYGRSLRVGQTPGYITDLADYDAEIDAARELIAADGRGRAPSGSRRLILLGHSTGGLVLTLWAARHPGAASALVLNSPWLELQAGSVVRSALEPVMRAHAAFDPRAVQPHVDLGLYTRAQAELGVLPVGIGDPSWRPERGFDTRPAWFAAILEGHRLVHNGDATVDCPVLVLLSTRSTPPVIWVPEMTSTDSVLVVNDIARAATRLGATVTLVRIDGAIHDVFLSAPAPRVAAFDALRRWLTEPGLRRHSRSSRE